MCIIQDTRNPNGQFGGPSIAGGSERDFAIPHSACDIPGTAAAFSLNVTVVPTGPLGYLTVWPTGQTQPLISTLNSVDGRIKANAAIVPAGSGGAISVYASNTTNVVLDINGYFVPATSSTLAFFPLTPCRVADTRWVQGPLGGPMLQARAERDFPLLSSSCNIPNSAQGYSLNFTAVPKNPLGYLTVWPTGQSRPLVSTLNDLTGTIVANAAIVPAGVNGAISVYATNDTELVIDVDGYFAPSNSGQDALSLYALVPCRVLDTRQTTGAFRGTLPVSVLQSGCRVPSARAYVLNATVVPQHGNPLGYLTLWPDAEDKPVVSTLNALDGAITSNMAIVSTLNGFIDAYATNPTDLVVDIFSYFAAIAPLSITTTSLPSATLNYNYSTTLGATGGFTPYAWSITSGGLPPGLNLDPASGVISGTPTMTGTYPFTLQVSDSQSPPATASAPLSITVNATLTQLSIVTTSLPPGTQNTGYSAMLAATGGLTPYTWSVTAGSLPRGLSLNSSTGAITGAPTGGGISNFTVQAADAELPPATASAQLSITISPAVPLSITTASLPDGTAGTPYNSPITAIGGVYPYTWSIISGSLPAGLTLKRNTGAITGVGTIIGRSNFTVQVTDSETPPVSATAQLSITINPGVVRIATSLPNGPVGTPYNATITATGGVYPYTWSIIAGQLPAGLTLNSSTGDISGTPTVVGTSYFTAQVTDSETPPVNARAQLSITVYSLGGGEPPGGAFRIVGPEGGGLFRLAPDPTHPGTIYASTLQGGIWKSTNYGVSWQSLPQFGCHVYDIQVSSHSGAVYAATNCATVTKSVDGGMTWSSLQVTQSNNVFQVVLDPFNDRILYALTDINPRLFRSQDGGSTWSDLQAPLACQPSAAGYLAADPAVEGKLYLGTCSAFYISTDGGTSWVSEYNGFQSKSPNMIVFAPSNPRTIYVMAGVPYRGSNTVFKSVDDGLNWNQLPASGQVGGLVVSPSDENTVTADVCCYGWTGLLQTTDGGQTWAQLGQQVPDTGISGRVQLLPSSPPTFIGSWGLHLWGTQNLGTTWSDYTVGLSGTWGQKVAVDVHNPSTLYLAGGNGAGINKSYDGGNTWSNVLQTFSSCFDVAVDPFDSNHVLTSCPTYADGSMESSYDAGITWQLVSSGFGFAVFSIAFDPLAQGVIYVASPDSNFQGCVGGIGKSVDGGIHWTLMTSGLTGNALCVQSLAIDPLNSQILIAGTNAGLYKSTNGGSSWLQKSSADTAYSVAFDVNHAGYVYTSANRVLKSTDNGETWSQVDLGSLGVQPPLTLVLDPASTDTVFLISFLPGSVGWSPDGGATWVSLTNGLTGFPLSGNVSLSAIAKSDPEVLYVVSPSIGLVALTLQH